MNKTFYVSNIQNRGRALIALDYIQAGTVLFEEDAYCFVVNAANIAVGCAHCGVLKPNETMYATQLDDPVRFCSVECMNLSSTQNQIDADRLKSINTLDMEGNKDTLRLVARIAGLKLHVKEKKKMSHPVLGKNNNHNHVMCLEAAQSQISKQDREDIKAVAECLTNLINTENIPLVSLNEVELLLLIIQCNAHAITIDNSSIGLGLFPYTSMMNHSCNPNCAKYFKIEPNKSPRLIIYTIRDITSEEELVYSYVPLYSTTISRQQKLLSAYGFQCSCKRCLDNNSQTNHSQQNIDVFPIDNTLDSLESTTNGEKVRKEIITCSNLFHNNPLASAAIVYKKLLSILSSKEKMNTFQSSDQQLLNAYILISNIGLYLLFNPSNALDFVSISQHVFYFTSVAIALIVYFTRTETVESHQLLSILMQLFDIMEGNSISQDIIDSIINPVGIQFVFTSDPIIQSARSFLFNKIEGDHVMEGMKLYHKRLNDIHGHANPP